MITATDLEVRAGSRILLSGAGAARAARRPDRPRRPQRRGQDDHAARARGRGRAVRRARSAAPARSATCRRIRARATSTVIAKDRVLSARGLDEMLREMEKPQSRDGRAGRRRRRTSKAVREYGQLEDRFSALGGYAAESEAARICASLGLPDRVLGPAAAHAVRRPAPPRRAGPDPVRRLRRRGRRVRARPAAARRADQPPRRRLDHLAARVPAEPRRRPHRDQPRHRAARRRGQQGVVPRRRPRRGRHLQHGLAAVPRRAGHRRAAPPPRTRQRREEGRRRCALQAAKIGAKATKAIAAQNMAKRADQMLAALDDRARRDKVAHIRFPDPAPCGKTPLMAEGLSKASARWRSSPGSTWPSTAAPGGGARAQRRGQDDAAAPARGRETPDAGEVGPGPRAAHRLLRPGARHARP